MKRQSLALTGGAVGFAGAVSLESTAQGVTPWRLPYQQRELFEPTLRDPARCPAGVRLTLVSDTASLDVEATCVGTGAGVDGVFFDLLVDGERHHRWPITSDGRTTVHFADLPTGVHRLEVYLSQCVPVQIHDVSIDQGAIAEPFVDTRPRWVTYGSSITHCGAAAGPSETWPAIVAQNCELNLTCLGYGGNCHLEPMVARMIRDLPADCISFCLGINTHGGTLAERTFRAAVIGLIQTVRDKQPATPIVCVSPICSPPREDTPGPTGMTLKLMREWIDDAVNTLAGRGDANLYHVSGLDILGHDELDWLADDQVHPHAQGYRNIGQRYTEVVVPRFGLAGVKA